MKLVEDLIKENHLEKVLASNLPEEIKQDWQEFFEEYEQKKETAYIDSVEKLLALSEEEAEKMLYVELRNINPKIIKHLYLCKAIKTLVLSGYDNGLNFDIGKFIQLRIVDIKLYNPNLKDTFEKCKNLYYLDISYNDLQSLPESIGKLLTLQKLDCSSNELQNMPDWIGNLVNLQQLDCDNNLLQNLPESVENLINLQHLSCWDNQLQNLPQSLDNLINLKYLNCNENKLQSIPTSIGQLTKLRSLLCHDNELKNLPESIGHLTKLQHLFCHNNKLEKLPNSIGNLDNLQTASFSNNDLQKLPLSFSDLRDTLQSLNYSENPFTEMPEIKGMGLGKLMDYLDEKRGRKSYTIPFEFEKILMKAFHKYLVGFGDFILQALGKEIGWQITVHNNVLRVHIEPRELAIEEIFNFLHLYIGEKLEINFEELQSKLPAEELFKRKRYIEDWKWERQTLIRDLEYERDKNRFLERENQEIREDKKSLKDLFQSTQKQLSDFILIYQQKQLEIKQTTVNQALLLPADYQPNGVRTVRMFLASSFELKDVRDEIRDFLSKENDKVMEKGNGIYVQIVQWESLPEHISQDRKQGDYNEELKNCEVFLSLFWTKVGKYTEEEVDLAYSEFKAGKQPYILYTYFKELAPEKKVTLSDDDLLSLLSFKKKLHNEIKHFQSNFTNIDNLLRQLTNQLENLPKLLKPKV